MEGRIGAIWAEASNGVIGDGESLLWHLPEDLAHFSELTKGSTVIMGRKTWDSLPEKFRPLPNRQNFVISRSPLTIDSAQCFTSVEAALAAVETEHAWVIGGGQIYLASLKYVAFIERTVVNLNPEGITKAPELDSSFELKSTSQETISVKTGISYHFETWARSSWDSDVLKYNSMN